MQPYLQAFSGRPGGNARPPQPPFCPCPARLPAHIATPCAASLPPNPATANRRNGRLIPTALRLSPTALRLNRWGLTPIAGDLSLVTHGLTLIRNDLILIRYGLALITCAGGLSWPGGEPFRKDLHLIPNAGSAAGSTFAEKHELTNNN